MTSVFVTLACVVAIAVVIISATWRNATRNKANDKITEAAVRMEYEDPERYAHGGREALQAQLKPDNDKTSRL